MALTKNDVEQAFDLLARGQLHEFLTHYVDEKVYWEITGSSVIAGIYQSREALVLGAMSKVSAALTGPIKMAIQSIYVDDDVAIVEMRSIATAKAGHAYDNQYAWIMKFSEGKIIHCRVYYDDVLVDKTLG